MAGLQESSPDQPKMHQNFYGRDFAPDPTGGLQHTHATSCAWVGLRGLPPLPSNPTPTQPFGLRARFAPQCRIPSDAVRKIDKICSLKCMCCACLSRSNPLYSVYTGM